MGDWAWRTALALALLAGWELAGRTAGSLLFPSASGTALALAHLLTSTELWRALLASHESLALGFAGAAAVGVPVGLVLGRWPALARWCDPHLDILIVTPISAIIPLLIMAAGLSVWARGLVVFAFAVPVVVVTAEAGMRDADPRLVDMARTFGATRAQVVRRVLLPSARPAIVTGLRLGLARAFSGMVVSELVLTATGIGGLVLTFQADFDAASVFAVTAVVVAEAVLLMKAATRLEHRFGAPFGRLAVE